MKGYFTERNYKGSLPYTDLALERHRADITIPGVEYKKETSSVGSWERIKISTKRGAESIGRPIGLYNTLCTARIDLLDCSEIEDAKDEIAAELCSILEESEVFPGRLLIAGLGNPYLTSDAIGCECAKAVKPTMHIKEFDRRTFESLNCAELAVTIPGVMATSGLDAAVTLRGLCDIIKPDAVVVIDALCSRSSERLGRTVQICNTGISPGSGLGNCRLSIGQETLGVPVIAIGVPTVIDSRMLCGEQGDSRCNEGCDPMFVSPKEINEIVSASAEIIGGGINRAFGIYS